MRSLLFWPVTMCAILMIGLTQVAPRLLVGRQLELDLYQREQRILTLETERQHLKSMMEIVNRNLDYRQSLSYQIYRLPTQTLIDVPQKSKIQPVSKKKVVKPAPLLTETLHLGGDEPGGSQKLLQPAEVAKLPPPEELPWLEFWQWLSHPVINRRCMELSLMLLACGFIFLHDGRMPSLWEMLRDTARQLYHRYRSPAPPT
jgi:hypothetical protein